MDCCDWKPLMGSAKSEMVLFALAQYQRLPVYVVIASSLCGFSMCLTVRQPRSGNALHALCRPSRFPYPADLGRRT